MIKVLIVEDDPMVAELNRRYLERVPGFLFCAIASTGNAALEILRTRNIDLVLLDIFMPGINGLELLSKIRAQSYRVDVIVVSAARDNESIQIALRNGAVDYLIKPFEFERLQAALLMLKKRVQLIKEHSYVSQSELDRDVFLGSSHSSDELPKGLDRNTVKRVWDKILETEGEFTSEEMAKNVGISSVSIRKYLKHFENSELLRTKILYGSVGRPVYKYCCTRKKE